MSTNGDDKSKKNPNAPKESKKTTREKAQAAREAAEAEQRRRDRRIRVIGAIVIIALVGGIIGAAVIFRPKPADTGTIVTDAKLPTGALPSDNTNAYGVPYKTNDNKPVLAIWEDFQCPICGEFEKSSGSTVKKLADDGTITLIRRPTTFLDQNFPQSNNSSARATAAWGCAIDAGKGNEYHDELFSHQASTEGQGWTDDQLMQFGKDVGITGDAYTTFTKCYSDKTFTQWTTNSYQTFVTDGIAGTPTLVLNGKEIPSTSVNIMDPATLTKYIQQNSGS